MAGGNPGSSPSAANAGPIGFSAFRNLENGLLSAAAGEGLLGELPPNDAAAVLASDVAVRSRGRAPVSSKICESVVSLCWPGEAGAGPAWYPGSGSQGYWSPTPELGGSGPEDGEGQGAKGSCAGSTDGMVVGVEVVDSFVVPSSQPFAAESQGLVALEAANSFGMPPRMLFLASLSNGSLAFACSANILPMPPRMPPEPKSGGRLASAFAADGNCPNGSGKNGGDGTQADAGMFCGEDGSGDRKIGGCQANAPARLAGICDQKAS
jgi:hypothetical protein